MSSDKRNDHRIRRASWACHALVFTVEACVALYIGQDHHISHTSQRNTASYYPSGWDMIKYHWDGKCTYTKHGASHGALCNNETSAHFWTKPSANTLGRTLLKVM